MTPVDKVTHNQGLICNQYYQYIESKEISTPTYKVYTYETSTEIFKYLSTTPKQLVVQHQHPNF